MASGGDTTMAMTDQTGPGLLGVLLRRYRVSAGLSQAKLAERAMLSRRGVSDLERGTRRMPHPATVRQFADALNLDDAERAALLASVVVAAHRSGTAPGIRAQHNLPLELTSFIGRERELEELPRLLTT